MAAIRASDPLVQPRTMHKQPKISSLKKLVVPYTSTPRAITVQYEASQKKKIWNSFDNVPLPEFNRYSAW